MNKRYIDFVPKNGVNVVLPAGSPVKRPGAARGAGGTKNTVGAVRAKSAGGARSANGAVRAKSAGGAVSVGGTLDGKVGKATKPNNTNGTRRGSAGSSVGQIQDKPKLGVIEMAPPRFVKTNVEKRPLSSASRAELVTAKAKKLVKSPLGLMKKSVPGEARKKRGARTEAEGLEKDELRRARMREAEEIFEAALEQAEKIDEEPTRDKRMLKVPRAQFINTEKVVKRPLSRNVYPKKPVVAPEETPSEPVTIIERPEKDSRVSLIVTIIVTIILGAAAGTVAFLLLPK